jgi:glucose/arabinose dehydrogenase
MARHLNHVRLTAALSTIALAAVAFNSACDGSRETATGGATNTAGAFASSGAGNAAAGSSTASSGTGPGTSGSANAGGTGSGLAGSNAGGATSAGSASGGANSGGGGGASVDGTRVPGTNGYDCSPPSGAVPALKATAVVASGLTEPIFAAHAPNDDAGRLFVIERAGAIRIVKAGALVAKPFLDIKSKVVTGAANGDERGLLGMAFHPNYATNGLFYVHYSDKADANNTGDTIIEEYKVGSASADEADAASARLLLKVEQPDNSSAAFRNHKGGAINFGADGFLYIGLGDGGGSGDSDASHGTGNGQNLSKLLGKMLRLDPTKSASAAYTIPPGNLKDKMAAAAPEIWDYGLRNPFRSSFDGCTGDLYIGDVGQDKWEEVDIEKAGDGNKNYGWNKTEGLHCYQPASGCDETGITKPLAEHDHMAGKSITGGAVYRGHAIPGLRGTYFYADFQSNTIWSTIYDRAKGTASTPKSLKQDINNVTSIVAIRNGADGELYFVSLMGGLYRLEANP